MHERRWFVCVCLSVCECLSDAVSLNVEMKVPTRSLQHGADFYKKGFSYNRFSSKLMASFAYPTSDILRTFSRAEPSKGPKKANIGQTLYTWNATGCTSSSLVSVVCLSILNVISVCAFKYSRVLYTPRV